MSGIVKCDICGCVYNERHLSSHKRLSHGKNKASIPSAASEPKDLGALLALYERLPEEDKKKVQTQLAAPGQKRSSGRMRRQRTSGNLEV
jgi:hypothetical protein